MDGDMISKEYLDEERKKLWTEVRTIQKAFTEFKNDVEKRTPEYEKDARQASRKTSEYRNRAKESKELTESIASEVDNLKAKVELVTGTLLEQGQEIESTHTRASEAIEKLDELENGLAYIDDLVSKTDNYSALIDQIHEIHSTGEEVSNKISLLYSSVSKKKKEVDAKYLELFGYEEEDEETGESTEVPGLVHDLENSYAELTSQINDSKQDIQELCEATEQQQNEMVAEFGEEKEKLFSNASEENHKRQLDFELEHRALTQKIRDLLPDALTAGLSHGFSEKRADELVSVEKLNKSFNWSILGLVLVSLIPFAINVYLVNTGKSIDDVIIDMPRMLAGIVPLYIPLLWLAYSSNKKANLSKRLVEEYTHKEVLSKTFEGLSSQIESIEDEGISTDLRIKLLYNLLDVSAENPGKLISNYNTSDHPLMDALETSAKLSKLIDKVGDTPGLSKVLKLAQARTSSNVSKQSQGVEDALEKLEQVSD